MKLARAIHFDESDTRVYANSARTGEWCISGGFEFSNWGEGDLTGKARQAFSNGWLGLETFGRVTFVAVTQIEESEINPANRHLSRTFRNILRCPKYRGRPYRCIRGNSSDARLCDDHDPNTLLTVARELSEGGVHEAYRVIDTPEADLGQFAIHGSLDE